MGCLIPLWLAAGAVRGGTLFSKSFEYKPETALTLIKNITCPS